MARIIFVLFFLSASSFVSAQYNYFEPWTLQAGYIPQTDPTLDNNCSSPVGASFTASPVTVDHFLSCFGRLTRVSGGVAQYSWQIRHCRSVYVSLPFSHYDGSMCVYGNPSSSSSSSAASSTSSTPDGPPPQPCEELAGQIANIGYSFLLGAPSCELGCAITVTNQQCGPEHCTASAQWTGVECEGGGEDGGSSSASSGASSSFSSDSNSSTPWDEDTSCPAGTFVSPYAQICLPEQSNPGQCDSGLTAHQTPNGWICHGAADEGACAAGFSKEYLSTQDYSRWTCVKNQTGGSSSSDGSTNPPTSSTGTVGGSSSSSGNNGGNSPGDGSGSGSSSGNGSGSGTASSAGAGEMGTVGGGTYCDTEPVCSASPDDPSSFLHCENIRQQWLTRCPRNPLQEIGDGIYNGDSDHLLDINARYELAKTEYNDKFNEMKNSLQQQLSVSVGSGGGSLPCDTQNIRGVSVELGICARADFFDMIRGLFLASAAVISAFIILRK